jgi:hypothetical protein
MARKRPISNSKPTIAQMPASGKVLDFKATSLKQSSDVRPSVSPPAARPSLVGKSTGRTPVNKRGK